MNRIVLGVLFAASLVSFGCTEDDGDDWGPYLEECDPGELDCECLPDGGCDDGLECAEAWVEDPADSESFILAELCQ